MRTFKHLGYHLEVTHPISKKYLGYVKIEQDIVPDDAVTGYYSRKLQTLNHRCNKRHKAIYVAG